MRALDPRLVRRAGAVRALLALDVALGVIAALLVLAQAVLIAAVAARAFDGASLDELTVPLALLVAASIGRAAAASGFEIVGRRAATDVLATLRLELVERRLRDQPAALDGAESAEVATAAVGGRRRARDDVRPLSAAGRPRRHRSRSRCSCSSR